MVQLEDVVSHMAETQASFASNNTGACNAPRLSQLL